MKGVKASFLVDLAKQRADEAKLLLTHRHFSGAAYISGYAVELLLKATLASTQFAGWWPLTDVAGAHTHDLEDLLATCGLGPALHHAGAVDPELGINWIVVREWRPNLRYRSIARPSALDLVQAVTDERHGVASWLRRRMEGQH